MDCLCAGAPEKGAKALSEAAVELAKKHSGRVLKTLVRTVSEKQVSLGLVVTLGTPRPR